MKPLFIPLKREWFEAFERGEKTHEYRIYGPRWNATTCAPGRAVLLSYGYSGRRLSGVVRSFTRVAPEAAPAVARDMFPGKHIADIEIADLRPVTP